MVQWLLPLLMMAGGSGTAVAEDFGTFLSLFLENPATQSLKTEYPASIDGRRIAIAADYKPVVPFIQQAAAIICADSIEAASAGRNTAVNMVNMPQMAGQKMSFARHGATWRLKERQARQAQMATTDGDFLSFLVTYSTDHDFQMKRTIFPVPVHQKGKGSEETQLQMPRNWSYISFTAMFPQMCVMDNNSTAKNRRLYFYQNNRLRQIYNFININKKWFLIEIENY